MVVAECEWLCFLGAALAALQSGLRVEYICDSAVPFDLSPRKLLLPIFPHQQNAMGSLHNIDFGVFWASWGGSGKEPGSGNRFRELVPGCGSG